MGMQSLIDQMGGKIKSYKKQIEEAEEIAALNLAKYRQVQSALGVAEERADMSEQALARMRTEPGAPPLDPCKADLLRLTKISNLQTTDWTTFYLLLYHS